MGDNVVNLEHTCSKGNKLFVVLVEVYYLRCCLSQLIW